MRRHIRSLIVAIVVTLLFVAGLLYVFMQAEPAGTKRLVTFYDRSKKTVILTRATTVQEALRAANITVDSHDIVEPTQTTTLAAEYEDVIIYRSRLVAVIDGSIRQTVQTVAQSPNSILNDAGLEPIGTKDKAAFKAGDLVANGTSTVLVIERVKEAPAQQPQRVAFAPRPNALTASKGAQVFVDSQGVAHRETYYDLPMNRVITSCGPSNTYSIRSDGAKIDQDGYVLVAANLVSYPRCTVVETSLGPAKVYDTGGFAVRHPYGFDLATDWTNYNGQ